MANYRDFSAIQITLLAIPPVQAVDDSATGLPLLRSLLLDPIFQLK
jgi:hypothetical protein